MHGKVVVITGATSGIGQVAAERLAGMGARVLLVARDRARGAASLSRLRERGPGLAHRVYYGDLSSVADTKRVAAEIATAEPRIDVLINNAGALFNTRRVTATHRPSRFRRSMVVPDGSGRRPRAAGWSGFGGSARPGCLQLTGNLAEHNEEHGFLVGAGASSIVLKGNHAVSNVGDGFQINNSTRSQVIANNARGNAGNGFFVTTSANKSEESNLLRRNSAVDNGMNGIAIDVTSIRNRVVGNTVTGHIAPFFELLDKNPNCRRPVNTWTGNTFVTKSPDCLR